MSRVAIGTAALVATALVLAGCGSKSSSDVSQVSGRTEVELDDDYFAPKVLQGMPGDQVTLELKNEGKVEHNFSVDAQGVDEDVEPGADATVTVRIPQSGRVSFYCSYHKAKGMVGTIEPAGSPTTETTSGGGYGY